MATDDILDKQYLFERPISDKQGYYYIEKIILN